ncbi:MAG: LacI family transcriptional regulator [Chitinophagaceae bacterium]|nr:LacI family transcriptional regulator [Chitinophagaceae bacterium]
MSEINIRALAKALNLSIGTVSKALKDSYEISAETKERVIALAKALNYNPNPYASSLRRKKSNTIAVVIPEVADSFFSAAIKGIEDVAQLKGYHVLLYLTFEQYEKEKKILQECRNGRVDGILMSVTSETIDTVHISELLTDTDNPIPLVFFDRAMDGINVQRVTTNDFESSFAATQHLIDAGCRNIVYLSVSKNLHINNKRIAGFKQALLQNHLKTEEHNVADCSNDGAYNHQLINKILTSNNRPDGIIAGVEKLIAPVYVVCQQAGIHIPSQIKFISFSNLPYAPILNPSLTTVTQPAFEMGQQAATLLFKAIEKKGSSAMDEHIILPATLVIRNSTGMEGRLD